MLMPNYNPLDLVKATGQTMHTIALLADGDRAASIVPADSAFVLVAEAIARNASESFYENDTSAAMLTWVRTAEGVTGRFVAYISCSQSKLRIQQVLDIGAAASGQEGALESATGDMQAQLLLDEDFANVTLTNEQGSFVISNGQQKFKLLAPYQLKNTNGRFSSSAAGFEGGWSPFFKYLQAHGVNTGIVSKTNTSAIIFFAIFAIIFAAIFIYARHK